MASGITRLPTASENTFAFEITGTLDSEELGGMARTLNDAYDNCTGDVNILIIFRDFTVPEATVGFSWENLKAEFRSWQNVERYAVVGAPELAEDITTVFGRLIPVEVRVFEPSEEHKAWLFVGEPTESAAQA